VQWPKKPAICRKKTVDNKKFLSNSVNSFLVLIYLRVIKDADVRSKENGYIYVFMHTCICAYMYARQVSKHLYQTSQYLCLSKSIRLSSVGFYLKTLTYFLQRASRDTVSVDRSEFALTELHRKFDRNVTEFLCNESHMKTVTLR